MARMKKAEAILGAAEKWKYECLLSGGSIFSDERLWTRENFEQLVQEYVQKEKLGEGFWDSLELQLQDAAPEAQRLFAELVWVYYLIPVSAKAETKRGRIRRVWSWSGEEIPNDDWALGNLLEQGVIDLGNAALDIAQDFSFFVVVMTDWFSKSSSDRQELLNKPWDFADWLDRYADKSKPPFRHVALYLLFPDEFEPIVSRQHKAEIVAGFFQKWKEQSKLDNQSDSILLDQALLKIRKRLQDENGDRTTSFYDQPLNETWRPRESASAEDAISQTDPDSGTFQSLNTILYGPPGTGKTYATTRRCVEICDGPAERSEKEIRDRYRELVQEGRVEFITFHQSYGYEEFVEGLRPQTGETEDEDASGSGFRLEPVDGVLKRIADRARKVPSPSTNSLDLDQKNVFKMGLGDPKAEDEQGIFQECIRNGYALLGWGGDKSWEDSRFDQHKAILERWRENDSDASGSNSHVQFIHCFRNRLKMGDLIVVPAPQQRFRAVGEVTGPYRHVERPDGIYPHRREVRWLWKDDAGMPVSELFDYQIGPKTIYKLDAAYLRMERLRRYIGHGEASDDRPPHVLVIDEINRANVSRVMGELVTLLEEDKREGADNEVHVILPHSKRAFTLPANLHILGTMNTADRSIALLDTALRRRFVFEELPPEPKTLEVVDGIDLPKALMAMNKRLEWLLGRDHLIGHAWLMGAKDKAAIDRIMRRKIIPMLAEYFHDDWGKIRAVLGGTDDFVLREKLGSPPDMEDIGAGEDRYRWTVRGEFAADAWDRLVSGKAAPTGVG